jgi:para-nitrobenzyl esterase
MGITGTERLHSHRCRRLCGLLPVYLLLLSGCGGSSSDSADANPLLENEVAVAQGRLSGTLEGELRIFRGVRYAAALTPQRRFMAPLAAPKFSGIYDATQSGSDCAQPLGKNITGAEDCLFANIWAHRDSTVRPVIVFIHGGADGGVSGSMAAIDGATLAANAGVIVVTMNRRLGVIGNLALDELIAENPRGTAGNYEVLDSIQALKWVQQNIAAFNGDPNRVMLAGNSFGGRVICHILAAPEAAGLFQSVAIHSGACGDRAILSFDVQSFTRHPPALYEHRFLVAEAGCEGAADILTCLRGLPVPALIQAAARVAATQEDGRGPFGPIIDGVVVQTDPLTALQNQTVGDIAVIAGATQDDVEFLYRRIVVPDDATYRSLLAETIPAPLDSELYAIYPSTDFATPKDAYLTAMGDIIVNCMAEELVRSARSGTPGYLYLVSRGFDNGIDAGRGATHSIDVTYLFESFAVRDYLPDAEALTIAAAMQTGWANLARDALGTPAIDGLLFWPVYEPGAKPHIDFGAPVQATGAYRDNRCDQLREVFEL